jgi:fatty acid desaturase
MGNLEEPDTTAYTRQQVREAWLARRRRKIREEVERNRRGENVVPTWVLALALVLFVAAWAALIILA